MPRVLSEALELVHERRRCAHGEVPSPLEAVPNGFAGETAQSSSSRSRQRRHSPHQLRVAEVVLLEISFPEQDSVRMHQPLGNESLHVLRNFAFVVCDKHGGTRVVAKAIDQLAMPEADVIDAAKVCELDASFRKGAKLRLDKRRQ